MQKSAIVFITLLTVQILVALWCIDAIDFSDFIDVDSYFELLAVISIIVGLKTLIIPVLMRIGVSTSKALVPLVLTPINDSLYKDPNGISYEVKRLEEPTQDSTQENL